MVDFPAADPQGSCYWELFDFESSSLDQDAVEGHQLGCGFVEVPKKCGDSSTLLLWLKCSESMWIYILSMRSIYIYGYT